MILSRILRRRSFIALALVMLMSVSAYGFAASNTVPTSQAGDGNAAISGYTITNVHYNLNATDPANIDSVTFTINPAVPAGGTLKVRLIEPGGSYFNCTLGGGGTSASCNTPGVTVLAANNLRVIAAD